MLNDLQAATVETLNHNAAVRLQLGTENGTTAIRPAPAPGRAQHSSTPSSADRPWMSLMAIPTGNGGRSGRPAKGADALAKEQEPAQAATASPRGVLASPAQVASTLQAANSAGRGDAPLRADLTPLPVSFAPIAEPLDVRERPQLVAPDPHQNPALVAPAAPAVSSSATSPGNPKASASAATQDSGNAGESAVQDPVPESDATGANQSPEQIAFGARLIARNAEQPPEPSVPTSRPVVIERLSSPGASSGTPPETTAHREPSENGTSTAATEEKTDPTLETNAQDAPGQRTGHAVPDATSIAHADQTSTLAAGHHQPVQESGYAPSPARASETVAPAPSAPRASISGAAASVPAHETAAPDAPGTGSARDIALRLTADDNSAVEVRLSERAGEVRVAVRSADPALTESMRARLPELVDRLGARGYETETWRPEQPAAAERGGNRPNPDSHREQPGEQQPGNGQQKRDQPQPEWMEELSTSLRQPNAVNRSTNR
jgi:hypothetical protein